MTQLSEGENHCPFRRSGRLPERLYRRTPGVEIMAAAALILACPAYATEIDDLSLDDLSKTAITTASRFSQPISESPASATVICGDEIRSHGWSHLAEALASVPGFEISTGTDYHYLGVRGFSQPGDYNSRILLLIDGIPTNDGVYDQAMIGPEFPIDMDLIERIEVVPGPGSALYGGNAFLAVVNVITRCSDCVGRNITVGAGTGRMLRGQASAGGRDENGRHWLVSASLERSHGEDWFFPQWQGVNGSDGWARNQDGERLRRLLLRYGGEDWNMQLLHGRREKDAAGGLFGSDFSVPEIYIDETTEIGLHLARPVGNTWRLESQVYAGEYNFEGRYRTSGIWASDLAHSGWVGASTQLSGQPWDRQTWVLGVSVRDDYKRVQENIGGRVQSDRITVGVYAQDEFRLSDRLTLNLGSRYDRDTLGSHQVSPRGALVVDLPRAMVWKLLAGKAFRPPNAFETEYRYPGSQVAGGDLRPERVTSAEMVLEQAVGTNGRWTASLYRNRFSDLLSTVTDLATGLQQVRNVGNARTEGLELGMQYRVVDGFAGGLSLRASLAWQHSKDDSGEPLPNSPRFLGKFLAIVPFRAYELGWETYYTGQRRDIFGNPVGGQAVSHAAISGRLSRNLRWQVRASNLFDRRLLTVVGPDYSFGPAGNVPTIADYGRQVRAQLTVDF